MVKKRNRQDQQKVISRPSVCQLPLAGTANFILSRSVCGASETCLLRRVGAKLLAAFDRRSKERKDEKTAESRARACSKSE